MPNPSLFDLVAPWTSRWYSIICLGLFNLRFHSDLWELRCWGAEVVGSTPTRSIFSCYRLTALNWARYSKLSDKTSSNVIEEMIACYKSAVMEHIIQPIKDKVADLYLRYVPFIWNPLSPIARTVWLHYVSTTSVTLLALYVQNTSLLLLP